MDVEKYMIKKRILIITTIIILLVIILGKVIYFSDQKTIKKLGNSSINIVNHGFVCKQDEWIYYSNKEDNGYLYKKKIDGSKSKLITNDKCSCINVSGQWIYYINESDSKKVYKIKINGSKKTKIIDEKYLKVYYLHLSNGWIYYNGNSGVVRKKINKKEFDNIAESCREGFIINNYIYVNGGDEGSVIRKLEVNAKKDKYGKKKYSEIFNFNEVYVSYVQYFDGWIYYINNDNLFKMKENGTKNIIIGEDSVRVYCIDKGWIYFSNKNDHNKLYKMKHDGTKKIKLSNSNITSINLIDNWIYYTTEKTNFRIKNDGTQEQIW
jgi:hypothetical protein